MLARPHRAQEASERTFSRALRAPAPHPPAPHLPYTGGMPSAPARPPADRRPDLDDPEAVDRLVDAFYAKVLDDEMLAPIFTEIAAVDLEQHLPTIKSFWRKMLFGHRDYRRNMVARHVAVHARQPLGPHHFERWLALFTAALDEHFAGPYAERARQLAHTIAANLAHYLRTGTGRPRGADAQHS